MIENITVDNNKSLAHVKFSRNRKVVANFDQIMALDENDLATIPFTSLDYIQQARYLNEEELSLLKDPYKLSELEKEWMTLHDQYGYLSSKEMEKLVAFGVFPSKFKKLCNKKILCPLCIFGHMRKRPWRVKGADNKKNIRKEYQNYSGAKISTDQLVAQPCLVPGISGRHTKDRICVAAGFIDNYSGYSFSALQTSLDRD